MPFVAATNREIAHALHLVALTRRHYGLAAGYAREDARLRTAMRLPAAAPSPIDGLPGPADALAATRAHSEDADWFATRWTAGEQESMATHAARLAAEANAVPSGALLSADVEIATVASPTLGRAPLAITSPWVCAASPRAPGIALVLVAIAAKLAPALVPLDLDARDADLLRALLAASALERTMGGDEALDPWLPLIAATWLPAPSDVGVFMATIHRIASRALDQPPGEVDRIAAGLAQRRISRLRRAVRRAFFAPRGFDLDAWVAETR
jgi:hypothetical protein